MGESPAREASSWRTCSAPPAGEDVHRLGGVEGNSNDDALRVIDKGQGDGVKKLAGWTTTTTTRSWLDGAQLDLHWGRRADADGERGRGRGRAELRGWDTIDIGRNRPVVVVEVHDRHDRRGSRAPRKRRGRWNVEGENRRRALRGRTPSKPDRKGLRGVEA